MRLLPPGLDCPVNRDRHTIPITLVSRPIEGLPCRLFLMKCVVPVAVGGPSHRRSQTRHNTHGMLDARIKYRSLPHLAERPRCRLVVHLRHKTFPRILLEQLQYIFLQLLADGFGIPRRVDQLKVEFRTEPVEFRQQRRLVIAETVVHVVARVQVHARFPGADKTPRPVSTPRYKCSESSAGPCRARSPAPSANKCNDRSAR